ncbi:aminopeptidase P family protein [Pleomorphomonas koreensis]|uniref:aminopeptidase P family protein n=1 Tax=Pleomorphomonas koreensis TaxID=257440 RepID=UPI0003FB9D4A|nr:aminopeptidase P family protein [Pleomorphomonas koreensis]
MFQTFDNVNDPSHGKTRLAALRAELDRRGLQGFLVPLADEHQGEYIPASARRLLWLTGFAGSAGLAVVLKDRAAIFVDGRYTLQVREQVDLEVIEPHHLVEEPPHGWLKTVVGKGDRIGFDPWLMTAAEVERFETALAAVGAELVATEGNPVDAVWADQPPPPQGRVSLFPESLAGTSAEAKLARLAEAIGKAGADAAVLTRPDSIAWAFNIRGADVPHTPEALSFAILRKAGRPSLFIDGGKLDNAVRDRLEQIAAVEPPAALAPALSALACPVLVDKASAAYEVARRIEAGGGKVVAGADPVVLPKALKNPTELAGIRAAHVRDGVAMVRFLAWIDREAPKGGLDEIAVTKKLEEFRVATGALRDISFDTIAGAGPNAAIPHYHVSTASNRKVEPDGILLVDSGAQYEDGTTDITRTMIVGTPTGEMADRFTRVLIGHIRLALARFPKGTTGAHLDILARETLWEAGLDFDHGTGHGVGHYLSVHEGPARIAKAGHVPLEPGMLLSNEPGYYKAGAWGIRIENLVIVTAPEAIDGGERPMMGFETVTLAPIDRRLIRPDLMAPRERAWLDAYHAEVRDKLLSLIDDDADRAWLVAATAPLSA